MGVITNWKNAEICTLNNTQMRRIGFWDITEDKWMYYKNNTPLNITFFFILNKNFPKNKRVSIKVVDRETKQAYSITTLYRSPFKDNPQVYNFLKEIYDDFCKQGFLKIS